MIGAAMALLGGNLSVALLKFARNILVARLLSVENFGIAATFAIIFGFVEMLAFLGLDRFLIQTRNVALERVQATLHTMQVLRGVFVAVVLYLTAGPLAALMDVPEVAWAFRLMAVLPLIQGFLHLDMARAQRGMRFGPFVRITMGAEFIGLLSVWPLFLVFGDYRVVLGALIVQETLTMIFSHLVAERRYALGLDRELALRALRFGWPLLLNAALMFGIFQGDRIIVANQLGPVTLGLFSLAFMLSFMPTGVLAQTINRLFLPKLAPLQDDPAAFDALARVVVQVGLVVGLAVAVGFSIFGADLVLVLFGAKYAGALSVLVWLAVMQAVRVAKMGVSVVALARAETRSPMVANIPRVLLLPVAWLALERGAGMETVVLIATLGEMAGLATALVLLRSWLAVPVRPLIPAVLAWAAVLALVAADTALWPRGPEVFANFHPFQGVVLIAAGAAVLLGMRDLRVRALRLLRGAPFTGDS
jgi:O-antigen/teichoic acid export membrane protein